MQEDFSICFDQNCPSQVKNSEPVCTEKGRQLALYSPLTPGKVKMIIKTGQEWEKNLLCIVKLYLGGIRTVPVRQRIPALLCSWCCSKRSATWSIVQTSGLWVSSHPPPPSHLLGPDIQSWTNEPKMSDYLLHQPQPLILPQFVQNWIKALVVTPARHHYVLQHHRQVFILANLKATMQFTSHHLAFHIHSPPAQCDLGWSWAPPASCSSLSPSLPAAQLPPPAPLSCIPTPDWEK